MGCYKPVLATMSTVVMGLRTRSQSLSWQGGLSWGTPLTSHIWDRPHLGVMCFSTRNRFLLVPNYVDMSDSLT